MSTRRGMPDDWMRRGGETARRGIGGVILAVALAGCGGERIYPVRLQVTLPDGRPAAGCAVVLERQEPPAITAGGPIGEDGSCTPTVAGRTGPGLPAGRYLVAVTAETGPPVDGPRKPPPFPGRYSNPRRSGLEVTVGPDHEAAVTLSLTR